MKTSAKSFRVWLTETASSFSDWAICTSWFTLITQKTLIGKTSRRLKVLNAEILLRCSTGHSTASDGWIFSNFSVILPFCRGPRFFMKISIHSDPHQSKIKKQKAPSVKNCVMTHRTSSPNFRVWLLQTTWNYSSLCDEVCRTTVKPQITWF